MGRRHRPLASWPGDVGLAPHLLGVLKEGAIDVDIHFGEAVEFDAASDRKAVSRAMRTEITEMLTDALRRG
jgi:1-acyl-sn-glycerol-3-phosphate acyltransferase